MPQRGARIRGIDLEAAAWLIGLAGLALAHPDAGDSPSMCLFRRLGFRRCPGCGLGHSISYLFRGRLRDSLRAHPLGPLAVLIIGRRIVSLARRPRAARSAGWL